ncbi:MAG: MFS transporter [Erysipelotrichaceae bacterium]|nr:MFS transporter [Erysipelotrichaceae bacterium]
MSKKKSTFLSVAFVLAAVSMLCQNVATQMLNTTLSPFANYLWQSKTMGGLLTSFFNIGSIVMAFLSGPLIERLGKRKSIFLFSLLYGFATLLFVFMPKEGVSLFARVLQGIAKGVVTVACASVVAEVTPDENMNEGMGIYGLGNTLSMAFGPMIALNLIGTENNYSAMFLACAAFAACGALFGAGIRYTPKKTEKAEVRSEEYHGVWKLIEKNALPAGINYTIFFASFACVLVFSTVYAQEILGLSANQISSFYMVAAATMFVVRLFAGKIADRHGELTMIIPGHLCIIALLLLLTYGCKGEATYPMFLFCGALYGIGNATVQPALNSIAIVDSPAERSSIANATFYFLMDFGILFSSSVFGQVIDKAATPMQGYTVTYLASVGINLLSLFLAVTFMSRKARRKRSAK